MTNAVTETALAPARWLLEAGADGIPLTQTNALARPVVREAAERWPGWWHAELFGPPHREADLAVLGALHEGLRRLRLVRRRGRSLHTTARGRELADQPTRLLEALAGDLGGGDVFTAAVADAVTAALRAHDALEHDDLVAAALRRVSRAGWVGSDGEPPTDRDVSWVVADVLRRGEAYGLVERRPDPGRTRFLGSWISLSTAAELLYGGDGRESATMSLLVFDAELLNARGVRADLAVRANQPLTALHDVIQEAFGWYDDHLYSFWVDGVFWGDRDLEFTTPDAPDDAAATADIPIAELDLAMGSRIAYVFDFGDEWRVRLTLKETREADDRAYPRVLERVGTAPPQYPDFPDG